jgi:molybdopterin converting factor small subunit
MDKSIDILGEQYFYLKLHLDEMVAKAADQQEADELVKKYKASRRSFNEAINRIFSENNGEVKALKTALKDNTKQIKQAWENDQEIADILDVITVGVELGKDLVKLGQS